MSIITVNYSGSIDGPSIEDFCMRLALAKQRMPNKIHINLNSLGGEFAAAHKAHQFICNLKIPISVCNIGEVSSAALFLYLASEERSAVASSSFYIHPPAWDFPASTQSNIAELEKIVAELKHWRDLYVSMFNKILIPTEPPFDIEQRLTTTPIRITSGLAYEIGLCNSDCPPEAT